MCPFNDYNCHSLDMRYRTHATIVHYTLSTTPLHPFSPCQRTIHNYTWCLFVCNSVTRGVEIQSPIATSGWESHYRVIVLET